MNISFYSAAKNSIISVKYSRKTIKSQFNYLYVLRGKGLLAAYAKSPKLKIARLPRQWIVIGAMRFFSFS